MSTAQDTYRMPSREEIDAAIAEAHRLRSATIAGFFRNLFHRPARPAAAQAA